MKKLLIVLISVLMLMCATTSVFADVADTKDTNVKYEVTESYEWTVPTGTVDSPLAIDGDNTSKVTVTKNVIAAGKKLKITVVGQNDNGGKHYLVDTNSASNKLEYAMSGETSGVVLEVAAGTNTGEKTLGFSITKATVEKAGIYKDKLTFTAAVVSAS